MNRIGMGRGYGIWRGMGGGGGGIVGMVFYGEWKEGKGILFMGLIL
ncbi:SMR family transporter [Bacillus altitudinis]|nr:SMR family transporter [Bacillus altitudinis]